MRPDQKRASGGRGDSVRKGTCTRSYHPVIRFVCVVFHIFVPRPPVGSVSESGVRIIDDVYDLFVDIMEQSEVHKPRYKSSHRSNCKL